MTQHRDRGLRAQETPPGAEPNGDAIVAALSESVPREKHADTFSVLEQMDAAHPKEPHWYLPWLGVDAALQGNGLGAALLRHAAHSLSDSSTACSPRHDGGAAAAGHPPSDF